MTNKICGCLKDEDEFELIRTTEAGNEAMQKYYDFMDWRKYKPFDE